MSARACLSILVALLTFGSLACGGDPPDKEMQQAQGAIDAARAAGADQYAREEFTAAQEALAHANEAVKDRDYRLALNYALDSRERAQNAAAMAADGKAKARVDADRAITAATAAVGDLAAKVKAAEAGRASSRALAAARQALADSERGLQEARAAFDKGDYVTARTAAAAINAPAAAAIRNLESPPATPSRRRR